MFKNNKKLVLSLVFPIIILISVFFLLSSCNSLEFDAHSQQADHHASSSEFECHQSTFSSTIRNNVLLGIILLVLTFGLFANKTDLSLLLRQTHRMPSLTEGSPPRLFNPQKFPVACHAFP